MPQARNEWFVLSEDPAGKGLNLLNKVTGHAFLLEHSAIREFNEPDTLILRRQVIADERSNSVTLLPFVDGPDPASLHEERKQLVKDLLGAASNSAMRMSRMGTFKVPGREWMNTTRQLILEAFGEGEAALFDNAAGAPNVSSHGQSISPEVQVRLWRLANLIGKCDSMTVRAECDLSETKVKQWREKYAAYEHC